jgi:hypothetical protein
MAATTSAPMRPSSAAVLSSTEVVAQIPVMRPPAMMEER